MLKAASGTLPRVIWLREMHILCFQGSDCSYSIVAVFSIVACCLWMNRAQVSILYGYLETVNILGVISTCAIWGFNTTTTRKVFTERQFNCFGLNGHKPRIPSIG